MGVVNCSPSELCTYLRALEEGYLPISCSDTDVCVPSRSMSIASRSYRRGRRTVFFHGFPSLTMCADSMGRRGRGSSTSLLEGFPAPTSPSPGNAQGSKASSPGSGRRWPASLARYDRDTSSWRTSQGCLFLAQGPREQGWGEYVETWPRWGMTVDGALYPLPTLVPRTGGRGCGLWPTPDAHVSNLTEPVEKFEQRRLKLKENGINGNGAGTPLAVAVRMWPTIRSTDGERGGRGDLIQAVRGNASTRYRMWATPQARDHKSGKVSQATMERNSRPLSERVGGSLNPDWVEWLMGWPVGWTRLEPMDGLRWEGWGAEPGDIPRVAVGVEHRVARLRALGNGQVPRCAAEAWELVGSV